MEAATRGTVSQELAKARERRAKFVGLIRRLEGYAQKHPRAYKRRVLGLALLGYAYILIVLLVSLGLVGLLVWAMVAQGRASVGLIKLLIIAVPVVLLILRSLWVRLGPAPGVAIKREEAPELYAEVDKIAHQLNAPKVDEIRMDEELNAAAVQFPRFGLFGPSKNYLLLGMQLMLAMRPDEVRSVIAHEMGHFSGNHGRFGGWVYRLNRTWEQLQANMASEGGGNWIFGWFFNWFEPLFDAYTFVLRRANEYDADRAAVQVAGAPAAARALMRLSYASPSLHRGFWRPLYERAKSEPEPPTEVLRGLLPLTQEPADPQFVGERLKAELREETGYADTHPALVDRLRSMGQLPEGDLQPAVHELAAPIGTSAAEVFLGRRFDSVFGKVEQNYRGLILDSWRSAHQEHAAYVAALAKLEEQLQGSAGTEDQEIERAFLVASVRGPEEARPLFEASLAKNPNHPDALFGLGQALLETGDATGVEYLRRAQAAKPEFGIAVTRQLAAFHSERGDAETVRSLQEEAEEAYVAEHVARREWYSLGIENDLVPHGLGPEHPRALAGVLAVVPNMGKAYLVRKRLPSMPESPRLVLIVFPKNRLFSNGSEETKLVERITSNLPLPEEVVVFSPPQVKPWFKRLDNIPGALVFDVKAR